jgi:hypothetical protein
MISVAPFPLASFAHLLIAHFSDVNMFLRLCFCLYTCCKVGKLVANRVAQCFTNSLFFVNSKKANNNNGSF